MFLAFVIGAIVSLVFMQREGNIKFDNEDNKDKIRLQSTAGYCNTIFWKSN